MCEQIYTPNTHEKERAQALLDNVKKRDINKRVVRVDSKTQILIPIDADPQKAIERYLRHVDNSRNLPNKNPQKQVSEEPESKKPKKVKDEETSKRTIKSTRSSRKK